MGSDMPHIISSVDCGCRSSVPSHTAMHISLGHCLLMEAGFASPCLNLGQDHADLRCAQLPLTSCQLPWFILVNASLCDCVRHHIFNIFVCIPTILSTNSYSNSFCSIVFHQAKQHLITHKHLSSILLSLDFPH